MIRENGTLTAIKIQQPQKERDDNGDPIKAEEILGEETACNIKLKTDRKFNYENGATKISTYEILIEAEEFNDTRVRLKNNRNQELGDFEVLSIEYLDIAQRVKITV